MENKEQLGAEIRQKLAEIEVVAAALQQREEDLEDEINDMFAGVAAALEDRRRSVLAQLRSRVEGKCKRLGGEERVKTTLPVMISCLQRPSPSS